MSKYNLTDIFEQYQIGSGWTRDFDYDGMLKAGLKTGVDTDLELLKKMVEDYTDVNYHREAHHLYNAIEALEEGAIKEASMFFGDFHAEIKNTMKDFGMDIEPTVGQFMKNRMEGKKEVEEVTSREGSRIEGLLSIPLKSKFLSAFDELYFDLVEEDPFHAEDVIEHLSIEMMKHLYDIQAQGDRLAGLEEDTAMSGAVADELEAGAIGTHLDEGAVKELEMALLDVGTQAEVDQYMDSLKRSKDTFDNIDDYIEDFKNYVADKALQEHFGRFMKDYQ
jgi:hypothetical protein